MTRCEPRELVVPCTVEIEQTPESFHAYAVPEDVVLRPGDAVLVHDAPSSVAFGECLTRQTYATVRRAGPLLRAWTRITAWRLLPTLYEVGFEPQEGA